MDQCGATSLNTRDSIARRISELARDLQSAAGKDFGPNVTVDELTKIAAQLVPGAGCAGITVSRRPGDIETVAATARYPVVLDDIQRNHGEGPFVLASRQQQLVRVDDFTTEDRWPRYSREVIANTPIRSMISFHLFNHRQGAGALNLYAEETHAFNDDSATLGLVFAVYTTLTWSLLYRDQQFRQGLASRDTIGQAKGMLMERLHIDAGAAFELLKQHSQDSNTRVIAVAQRLTEHDGPRQ